MIYAAFFKARRSRGVPEPQTKQNDEFLTISLKNMSEELEDTRFSKNVKNHKNLENLKNVKNH